MPSRVRCTFQDNGKSLSSGIRGVKPCGWCLFTMAVTASGATSHHARLLYDLEVGLNPRAIEAGLTQTLAQVRAVMGIGR